MSANRLLTREEVMELLQVKASHFSKIVNRKIQGLPPLAVVAIGRRQRFRPEVVEEWIKQVEKRCNGAH